MADDQDEQDVINFLRARGTEPDRPVAVDASPDEHRAEALWRDSRNWCRSAVDTFEALARSGWSPAERLVWIDRLKLVASRYEDHPDFERAWLAGAERARARGTEQVAVRGT